MPSTQPIRPDFAEKGVEAKPLSPTVPVLMEVSDSGTSTVALELRGCSAN